MAYCGSIPLGDAYCKGKISGTPGDLLSFMDLMVRLGEERDLQKALDWRYQASLGLALFPPVLHFRKRVEGRVEIKEMSMMDIDQLGKGTFDALLSIESIDYLSAKQRMELYRKSRRVLKPGGRAIWQSGYSYRRHSHDPWFNRYIAPEFTPSRNDFLRELEVFDRIDQWVTVPEGSPRKTFFIFAQNLFEHDEDLSLLLQEHGIERSSTPRILRTWQYYLLSCAAAFNIYLNTAYALVRN